MSTQDRIQHRQHWQSVIQDWQSSGLTQADYCRKHPLKSHQLNCWKRAFCTPQKIPAACTVATSSPSQIIAVLFPCGIWLKVPVEQHVLLLLTPM